MLHYTHMTFLLNKDLIDLLFEYTRFVKARKSGSIFEAYGHDSVDLRGAMESGGDLIPKLEYKIGHLNEAECKNLREEINYLSKIIILLMNCINGEGDNDKKYIKNDYINFLRWYYQDVYKALQDLKTYDIELDILNDLIEKWTLLYDHYANKDITNEFKTQSGNEFDISVRRATEYKGKNFERKSKLLDTAITRLGNITNNVENNNWLNWFKENHKKLSKYHDQLLNALNSIGFFEAIGLTIQVDELKNKLNVIDERLKKLQFLMLFDNQLNTIQRNLITINLKARESKFSLKILQEIISTAQVKVNKLEEDAENTVKKQVDMSSLKIGVESNVYYILSNKILALYRQHPYLTIAGFATAALVGVGFLFGAQFIPGVNVVVDTVLTTTGSALLTGTIVTTAQGISAKIYEKRIRQLENKIGLLEEEKLLLTEDIKSTKKELESKQTEADNLRNELLALDSKGSEALSQITELNVKFDELKEEELQIIRSMRATKKENSLSNISSSSSEELDSDGEEAAFRRQQAEQLAMFKKQQQEKKLARNRSRQKRLISKLADKQAALSNFSRKEKNLIQKLNVINKRAIQVTGRIVNSKARKHNNYYHIVDAMHSLQEIDKIRAQNTQEKHMLDNQLEQNLDKLTPLISQLTGQIQLAQALDKPIDQEFMEQQLALLGELSEQTKYQPELIKNVTHDDNKAEFRLTHNINSNQNRIALLKQTLEPIISSGNNMFELYQAGNVITFALLIGASESISKKHLAVFNEIKNAFMSALGEISIRSIEISNNNINIIARTEQQAEAIKTLIHRAFAVCSTSEGIPSVICFPRAAAQTWLNGGYHDEGGSELYCEDRMFTLTLKSKELNDELLEEILGDFIAIVEQIVGKANIMSSAINRGQLQLSLRNAQLVTALSQCLQRQGFGMAVEDRHSRIRNLKNKG